MRQTEPREVSTGGSTIDGDSFQHLWERYASPVAYVVGRQLGSADVDDAVQEIMLRVFESRDRFDASRSLTAWVYTIARNYCSDANRCRNRRTASLGVLSKADVADLAAPQRQQPEALVLRGEQHRALHDALDTLGEADRLVLFLYYFEELPLSEVAGVLGRPAGTVKYRLHVARKALRRQLEGLL